MMDRTGSESCPFVEFGTSCVENSRSVTHTRLVS